VLTFNFWLCIKLKVLARSQMVF